MTDLLPSNLDQIINTYLQRTQPQLTAWTQEVWRSMGIEVSPSLAGSMVDAGELPAGLESMWASQYESYIGNQLSQRWAESMLSGESNLAPGWRLLTPENVNTWMDARGPVLFDGLTSQQSSSVNRMIRFFATEAPVSQDTMASLIRPAAGLTERQAGTLISHYQSLIDRGATPDQTNLSVSRMASKLQTARANLIARTELATAYNGGIDVAIRAGMEDDAFEGELVKTWRTQEDERVCKICGPLDRTSVEMGESFSSSSFTGPIPPAHPQCRCVVLYEEQT